MAQAALQALRELAAESEPDEGGALQVLERALSLVAEPLVEVQQRVAQAVAATPEPARAAARQLVEGGGKAVRPAVTLLAARAVGGDSHRAVAHAAAAELAHNATLLHDDVIDDGVLRRGRAAARVLWGNTVSVLSGDLLFVAALRGATAAGPAAVVAGLIETVGTMVEGEVLQFRHRGRFELDRSSYQQIIERKTAALFRWCARAGASAGGASAELVEALGRYGRHLGIAFQLRDDVLDLTGQVEQLGKSLAADLREGKLTLPLIAAIEQRPSLAAELTAIARAGSEADPGELRATVAAVRRTGAVELTRQGMQREIDQAIAALGALEASPERDALGALAQAIGARNH